MTNGTIALKRLLWFAVVGVAAFILLYVLVGRHVESYFNHQDDLGILQGRLVRYQNLAAQKAGYESGIERIASAKIRWSKDYLSSASRNLAEAELQRIVLQLVRRPGISVARSELRGNSTDSLPTGVAATRLALQLTADYASALHALQDIENADQILIVNQLDIRPKINGRSRRSKDARQVDVLAEITGFYLADEEEAND